MSRTTTTLELDCEICDWTWEAETYADFKHYDLVPEFIEPEDAVCPKCDHWILPRVGTGIGDAILHRFHMVSTP